MITGMTFGHQFNIALLSNMDAQFKTLKERWLLLLSDKGKIAKLNGIFKSHINLELRFLTPHYFLHISNSIFSLIMFTTAAILNVKCGVLSEIQILQYLVMLSRLVPVSVNIGYILK